MTLSLLMYALMTATLVVLAGMLVVDAVRGLSYRHARRATRSEQSSAGSVAPGVRSRRLAPTRS